MSVTFSNAERKRYFIGLMTSLFLVSIATDFIFNILSIEDDLRVGVWIRLTFLILIILIYLKYVYIKIGQEIIEPQILRDNNYGGLIVFLSLFVFPYYHLFHIIISILFLIIVKMEFGKEKTSSDSG